MGCWKEEEDLLVFTALVLSKARNIFLKQTSFFLLMHLFGVLETLAV